MKMNSKKTKINKTTLLVIIIAIQVLIFIYFMVRINTVQDNIIIIDDKIKSLDRELELTNEETQNTINQLSESLIDTKENLIETQSNLEKQISTIKAETSADFSGIIEDAVKAVVTLRTDKAQGTGFIITNDGYIVTNYHVIEGARYADAITSDQNSRQLTLIGYNSQMDIALLKIEGSYNHIEFDDSDDVKIGEKVIAIGNPLGLSFSVTEGIISAVNRKVSGSSGGYIQTDAALNSGNSGGPLINTNGRVIGINNFKVKGDNIGFALESNYIIEEVNKISSEELGQELL